MSKALHIPFWERTKKMIRERKITQIQFADQININYNTFKNWLYIGIIPDVHTAYNISTILGVSMEYLVTGRTRKLQ